MKLISMRFAILLSLVLFLLNGCKAPELAINPKLAPYEMKVKGRQGWQINQVIRFGNYHTDKVQRGWRKSYDIPFVIRFQGASQRLSFMQFGASGHTANVMCAHNFRSEEISLLEDYFFIPLKYEDYFAGTIFSNSFLVNWDFIIHNPEGDTFRETAGVAIRQRDGDQIFITGIRNLKGQSKWIIDPSVKGYEFSFRDKVIGAVSTINNGKVWIDEDLDSETQLILAALSSAILLRHNLHD